MDAVSKNLRTLVEREQIKQSVLANVAGVTEGSVSGWLSGRTIPRTKPLERIANYYFISLDDLVSETNGLYAKEHGLTEAPGGAMAVSEPKRANAPLYGIVHAGDADEPIVIYDYIPTPYEVWEHHKSAYWLEVKGDCMDKVYPPGCFVFVDPDAEPHDGSIVVVSIDGGDYVMRRLRKGASVILLSPDSHNSEWDDIVIAGDHELRIIGVVVWFQSSKELD